MKTLKVLNQILVELQKRYEEELALSSGEVFSPLKSKSNPAERSIGRRVAFIDAINIVSQFILEEEVGVKQQRKEKM